MDVCPKLRADLQVSEQRTPDGIVYVLKELASGRIFRLPEVAYFIARQLDGRATPEEIRASVERKFTDALPPDAFESFCAELRKLGLLEGGTVSAGVPPVKGRLRGDLLYLRWKAFDPDAFLDRLLPKLRFCFTPGFLLSSAVLVLLGIGVAVSAWPDIQQELGRLNQFHAIAYAWFILLLTVSLHELAHGLTCKHFGGQVREAGLMFIYFQPAFYCNVTDAWMFPEKAKRLGVTFAGGWFDFVLWALAVVLWRITDPDTWIHFTALVIIATSGIRMLFNLNPFIKLDGYYLLSDALDIPNLRGRAFRYLGDLWRRFWSGNTVGIVDMTVRERRVFVAYGLLAGVYSFALLGSIAWWFGGALVDRYGALGLLLFTVLLTVALRHPLKRSLLKLPQGLRAGPAWFRALTRPARIGVVAIALLASLFLIPATVTVSGEVTIMPLENADVRAEVEGTLAGIYVAEGDAVEAGELVARISDHKHRAELIEVEAAIQERWAKLKQLHKGSRGDAPAARLAGAQAAVAKAQEQLNKAEQDLVRTQRLVESGMLARVKLEDTKSEVYVRRRELEEAQAALQTVTGDAEAMTAEIESLEARRDFLRGQLEKVMVRSPHAGVITTPKVEQNVGKYVKEGDLIAEVHDRKQVMAEIAVPEREIAAVRVGQPVFLKARAYPGETFQGTVTKIAPATLESDKPSGSKIVRVTTVIDNPEQRLKTGMTGYAKIEGDKNSLAAVLARSVVGTLRVEVWSWW